MPSAEQTRKAVAAAEEMRAERLAKEAGEAANRSQAESSAAGAAQGLQQAQSSAAGGISSQGDIVFGPAIPTLRTLRLGQLKSEFDACMYFHRNASSEDLELATKIYEEVKSIIEESSLAEFDKLHHAFVSRMAVVLRRVMAGPESAVFMATGLAAGQGISWLPQGYANREMVEPMAPSSLNREESMLWNSYPLRKGYEDHYTKVATAVRHEFHDLGHVSRGDVPTAGSHSQFTTTNPRLASGGGTPVHSRSGSFAQSSPKSSHTPRRTGSGTPSHSRGGSAVHSSPLADHSPRRIGSVAPSHSRANSSGQFSPLGGHSPRQLEAARTMIALAESGHQVDQNDLAAARILDDMSKSEYRGPPFV